MFINTLVAICKCQASVCMRDCWACAVYSSAMLQMDTVCFLVTSRKCAACERHLATCYLLPLTCYQLQIVRMLSDVCVCVCRGWLLSVQTFSQGCWRWTLTSASLCNRSWSTLGWCRTSQRGWQTWMSTYCKFPYLCSRQIAGRVRRRLWNWPTKQWQVQKQGSDCLLVTLGWPTQALGCEDYTCRMLSLQCKAT